MNKIVMVTGATAGFGRAIAVRFAGNGFDVIITGRRKERLEDLEKELLSFGKGRCLSLNFDVRDREVTGKILSGLPEDWSRIDILINNAGLAAGLSRIDDGSLDDWDTMIDTNIKGLLYVTRAVVPGMVERNSGHIINLGSIAGKENYEYGNVYCASKAAVDSLTKSIRIDLVRHNIKVTQIAPGMAETEFSMVRFKGDEEKVRNVYRGIEPLTADDIAHVVYFCATLPPHVCINDLVITPTQQASVVFNHRKI